MPQLVSYSYMKLLYQELFNNNENRKFKTHKSSLVCRKINKKGYYLLCYQVDTSFLNEDCTKLLTCKMTEEGPILSQKDQPGCNYGQCKAVGGERQCVCHDNVISADGVCPGNCQYWKR